MFSFLLSEGYKVSACNQNNLKLKYEKGDFESHFDYLMQCSAYIKD